MVTYLQRVNRRRPTTAPNLRMEKARRDLAELPVKRMLINYFLQFARNNVVNWCRIKHVPMIKIPKSHISTANVISTMQGMPKNFISSSALFYMPTTQKPLVLEKQHAPGEIWSFTLTHHPAGSPKPVWKEDAFDHFEKQTNKAKETIGVLLVCAQVYVKELAAIHNEMKGISLELNTEDMVLRLVDTNLVSSGLGLNSGLGNAAFEEYISVAVRRMTPEEIDAYYSDV